MIKGLRAFEAVAAGFVAVAASVAVPVSVAVSVPAGAAGAAAGGVTGAPLDRTSASESSNWSGYFVTGATGHFHSVTAKWTVTAVSATASPTYSASWVGIDGATNTHLIQTGTESDYYGGAAHYDAWWEILPAAETVIPSITVVPGDVMTASISKGTSNWTITITNTTTGRSFTTTKNYSGPGTSAEWIEERPTLGNGNLATLARYGKVVFDPGTANGANPGLKAANRILMTNSTGTKVLSDPSNPDSDTDGFRVAYGSSVPTPPSS